MGSLSAEWILKGMGLGFLAALGTGGVAAAILTAAIASSDKQTMLWWVWGISMIMIGRGVGAATRKGAGGHGGLLLQVAAVAWTLLAIVYSFAPAVLHPYLKEHPDTGALGIAILLGVGTPVRFVEATLATPWIGLWLVFGALNAARATGASAATVRGPFSAISNAPAPPGAVGTPRPVAPPPAPNARAAGLDFERPQ